MSNTTTKLVRDLCVGDTIVNAVGGKDREVVNLSAYGTSNHSLLIQLEGDPSAYCMDKMEEVKIST